MSPSGLSYLKTTVLAALLAALAFGLTLVAALNLGGIAKGLSQVWDRSLGWRAGSSSWEAW